MNNVLDDRYENSIVVSKKYINNPNAANGKKVGIFVNLYYERTLNQYLELLNDCKEVVDVHIATSNDAIYETINKLEGIHVYLKNNRGRDISALLVVYRELVKKYDYICFVHDKEYSKYGVEMDAKLWKENLIYNAIASKAYVLNVIDLFNNNEKLGFLSLPEPVGEVFNHFYNNTWGSNFDNVKVLLEELCPAGGYNLDINKPSFSLGTVFWARVKSIMPIFDKKWDYTDFDEEPLALDGTISHAIERSFPYIAQSKGYISGVVMNEEYSGKLLGLLQKQMTTIFDYLNAEDVVCFKNIVQYQEIRRRFNDFCKNNAKNYIYGAGKIATRCAKILLVNRISFDGVIVSNLENNPSTFFGVEVKEFDDIKDELDNCGIVIALGKENRKEVEKMLLDNGFTNYIFY